MSLCVCVSLSHNTHSLTEASITLDTPLYNLSISLQKQLQNEKNMPSSL